MSRGWVKDFTPVERHASVDLEQVVNSFEWIVYGASGLMAIVLFIVAANRSKEGDTMGAVFSSVGAVICATAPIIAKSFSIGG